MNKLRRHLSLFLFAVTLGAGLGACRNVSQSVPKNGNLPDQHLANTDQRHALAQTPVSCRFKRVEFQTGFETARLSSCRKAGNGDYQLFINPEATPINPSPWYGFDVVGAIGDDVNFEIIYGYGKHRYGAKFLDGPVTAQPNILLPDMASSAHWRAVKPEKLAADRKSVRYHMRLTRTRTRIAAQAIINNQHHRQWTEQMATKPFINKTILGRSAQGREITVLETNSVDAAQKPNPYLIITGRQHPPETTGAQALAAFVDTVLSEDDLARRFRARFNVMIVPNLNPDGVAHGNWRNTSGTKKISAVDLNRDWGPFSQAESALMERRLSRFKIGPRLNEKTEKLALFLDFHSTWRNLFYIQSDTDITHPKNFSALWLEAARQKMDDIDYPFSVEKRHNTDKPTSKNYIYGRYGVPAITYEVGDKTDRQNTKAAAEIFAVTMMQVLLSSPP